MRPSQIIRFCILQAFLVGSLAFFERHTAGWITRSTITYMGIAGVVLQLILYYFALKINNRSGMLLIAVLSVLIFTGFIISYILYILT